MSCKCHPSKSVPKWAESWVKETVPFDWSTASMKTIVAEYEQTRDDINTASGSELDTLKRKCEWLQTLWNEAKSAEFGRLLRQI